MDEELKRVLPVLEHLAKHLPKTAFSIDTFHACVAREALQLGAEIVNDVSGATQDADMASTIAQEQAAAILMHSRGTPSSMHNFSSYADGGVARAAGAELRAGGIARALQAGVPRWSVIADCGVGFAKKGMQNVEVIRDGAAFSRAAGRFPCTLGLSRKRWLQDVAGCDSIEARDWGTAGAVAAAVARGGVDIVRVHRPEIAEAVRACDAICYGSSYTLRSTSRIVDEREREFSNVTGDVTA